MTYKPTLAALFVAGLISGCASQAPVIDGVAPLGFVEGRNVPAGVACEQLVETLVNTVAGCNGFVPMPALSSEQAAQIALLNTKLASEASPTINFDSDNDRLTPSATALVDAQAVWMLRYQQVRFSVFGHTDLVGSEAYNFALAKRRAETVIARLISRGVNVAQLDALVSYGKQQPLIDTTRPEVTNRRTVTVVTGYLDVPRLYTSVPVDCAAIKPSFLPSHPTCVAEADSPVPAPAPAPSVQAPSNVNTASWETQTVSGSVGGPNGRPEASTSATKADTGTAKTSFADSRAGDLTTSVGTIEKDGVRSVYTNGELVATSNLDGSNLQAVQN